MTATINLPAIVIANIMGVMLCLVMLIGRRWKIYGLDSEKTAIHIMMLAVLVSCIVDPLVFYMDGRPGQLAYLTVYIGNLWLFLSNVVVMPAWFILVVCHVQGRMSLAKKILCGVLTAGSIALLIANQFTSLLFRVDESNVYHRGPFYFVMLCLDLVFLLDSLFVYYKARKRGGVLQFFPVWQFLLPMMVGTAIQSCCYGVSTIWPFLAISINGLMYCLQSETIYRDHLTGLYNRHYLEYIQKRLAADISHSMGVMMIDMNDFKYINDTYGHAEGDEALKECAAMFRQATGTFGSVIRFAGDEFIVLVNTYDIIIVDYVAGQIRDVIEARNAATDKPYKLSAAIGCCVIDLSHDNIETMLHTVDANMYLDKEKYYQQHQRLGGKQEA